MVRDAIVIFDGTFDGFLCVIYDFYYKKISPLVIQSVTDTQLTLNEDEHHVTTNTEQAARVLKALHKKISDDAAWRIYYAFLCGETNKYMAIFEYIKMGFRLEHMVDSHLSVDCVRRVHDLARHTGREAHLLNGFCRFAETTSGVYYCEITPKNDVLSLIATHFTQRFMNQQWIIHDKRRNQAAIYDGHTYVIATVPSNATFVYAEGEQETQELWTAFFNTLAIEARKNPKLQRQLLPLYFRKNMTEFKHRFETHAKTKLEVVD